MPLLDPNRFLLIAGPCALESMDVCEAVAGKLERLGKAIPDLQIIFKGSFDKANRTSLSSPRGPGLEKGLEMLSQIKERYGFPVLTDIHSEGQAAVAARVVDVLQIPAFLCRQTDILVAAAKTGKVVNVKKGQFLSPAEMKYVVDKLEGSDAREIWLTERGTTFGYQNLVVDMRNFPQMKALGHPAIFDATHSVQMPGAGGEQLPASVNLSHHLPGRPSPQVRTACLLRRIRIRTTPFRMARTRFRWMNWRLFFPRSCPSGMPFAKSVYCSG